MKNLLEDRRSELVAKSRSAEKERDGKTRFEKRVKSKIASSVKQYNSIDMNQLFKDNILTVNIEVQGETDTYLVGVSFGQILDYIHKEIKRSSSAKLDLRTIIRSLISAFNSDNVYVRCQCPDFYYRFSWWLSKDDIILGEKQTIPSDMTNPNNTLGKGCKHILLVLNNTSWIIKVASVINNYVNYMKDHYQKAYADIIYPALYEKPYEEPVQLSIDDKDTLDTNKDFLDKANAERATAGRFKQGNTQGVRFAPKTNTTQMDLGELESEEEV